MTVILGVCMVVRVCIKKPAPVWRSGSGVRLSVVLSAQGKSSTRSLPVDQWENTLQDEERPSEGWECLGVAIFVLNPLKAVSCSVA